MRKGVTVEQARQAVEDTWQAGILPRGYLMIGMVGETPETVAETVRFCKETGLVSQFSYATPFPGTQVYDKAVELGMIGDDEEKLLLESWGEWTDEIVVNLSNMPNDELEALKRNAQRQIMWANPWLKLRRYIAVLGIHNALRETFWYLMKVARIGRYT